MANKHDIPLIPGIARVLEVRLLGVILSSSLSWSCQVDSILVAASQRLYLLNQLRHMLLDIVGLSNIFRALVVSKMLYALPAISGSLNQSDMNRLEAILRKAKRWGLTNMTETFGELSDNADAKLFGVCSSIRDTAWPNFSLISIKKIGILCVIKTNMTSH